MYRDFSGDPVVRTLLLLQGAQNKITYKFEAFCPQEERRNHNNNDKLKIYNRKTVEKIKLN